MYFYKAYKAICEPRLISQIAALATMIPCSYPLAIHYRTMPFQITKTLQQIQSTENNRWDPNLDHKNRAYGLYGIRRSSSVLGVDTWLTLPSPLSAIVQTVDVALLHLRKPGGGGIDKMLLQHHGAMRWSDSQEGALDPYVAFAKSRPYIPLPSEAILLLPFL